VVRESLNPPCLFVGINSIMLEQKWFVQFLYDFDDNKVLKNNWIYYLFNCAGSLNISIKY